MPADLPRRPSTFAAMFDDMELMFDQLQVMEPRKPAWKPIVDVVEDDEAFQVVIELPGVPPDDIEVIAQEKRLDVRGERRLPEHYKNIERHHIERCYGRFERSIHLPVPIDTDSVSTEMKNGVLSIKLPKRT